MTDVLDRLRGQSSTDLEMYSLGELRTMREQARTEANAAYDTMKRINAAVDSAGSGRMTRSQERDFTAAEKRCTEANELVENLADAVMKNTVDRSQILHVSGTPRSGTGDGLATGDARRAFGLSRHGYADGRPLDRDQSIRGFAASQGAIPDHTEDLSLRKFLRGAVLGEWESAGAERRAMSEGVLAGGGFMVPTILSTEIIDTARPRTRVLEAGARLVPMANKTVDVARWEGDPSASWHAENALIPASDATIGKVTLEARTLASLVVLSRELLEDADGIEDELRLALAAQFALTVDRVALYGAGTDTEPRGVANTTGVTTLSMGTNGAVPDGHGWRIAAVGTLEDADETPTATLASPRTARGLAALVDSTGQPLRTPDYLTGVPLLATNQIPNDRTAGTATAASEAFTADWSRLFVGVRTGLQLQVLTERYADRGQVGLLCWWRGDVAVARPSAFVRTTGLLAAS